MSKFTAVLGHYVGKTLHFFYTTKEETKIFFIGLVKGKQARKDYVLSKVKIPQTFYMHVDIARLVDKLNLNYMDINLLVDLHHVGLGKMTNAEQRSITMDYMTDYTATDDAKERRKITLDYLVKSGDVTERFLDFKALTVKEWLENTPPSNLDDAVTKAFQKDQSET